VTKVLVVDDSALMRKLLGKIFSAQADMEVQFARNGVEALALLHAFAPDVVTLDIHMPEMDGLACLDRIMVERPCPVVMISSVTAEGAETTLEALRLGAVDFIAKPDGAISLHIDELSAALIAKVRGAAGARMRSSSRLKERVRHRIAGAAAAGRQWSAASRNAARATGDGLVVVGTSTGGPPALEALLMALPADFAWPLVIAQHMPATFTGALSRRLDGLAELGVVEVTRPTRLLPGRAYIAQGDADMVLANRSAGLVALPARPQSHYPWHPSTDRLVRSAMDHLAAPQIVGILMTGMGNDGADAMAELHRRGGRTIAEAEETAAVWGMPGELVAAGGADWVLPLPEIATCLQKLVPDAAGS
jgi:two-component system chemotaxis response regulator CheB